MSKVVAAGAEQPMLVGVWTTSPPSAARPQLPLVRPQSQFFTRGDPTTEVEGSHAGGWLGSQLATMHNRT
jgi:hypothetical protein